MRFEAVPVLLVVVAAGCGGHRTAETGRAIFTRDCTSCHTLDGRERGAIGGDLVNAHLGVDALAGFARVMPVHPRLDAREAKAVARYIRSRARSARPR